MPIISVLGQSACYQVNDAFLGLKSHQCSQRNAVFKGNERGNAFNSESRRQLRLLVNIYLANSNGVCIFSAISSIMGASILHGPHQPAQKSISTVFSDCITVLSKFSEVITISLIAMLLYFDL